MPSISRQLQLLTTHIRKAEIHLDLATTTLGWTSGQCDEPPEFGFLSADLRSARETIARIHKLCDDLYLRIQGA